MAVHQPTLKQLQYLVALRDHGHFGRAADACAVTQSTLSAGLRELETLLDAALVERSRRIVRFTALGDRVADQARRVLREADALTDLARAVARPLSGDLRMSVIPTIAPFMLPRALPRLRAEYPELRLFLREEPSGAACDSLAHGRTDCVLLALPFACGDVETLPLFDDALLAAFPAAEVPTAATIEPDAIPVDRLLLLEDGHCLKDHALAACARTDMRGPTAMLGTSLHTMVQMVDNGLGMTLLPDMAVQAGILDGTKVGTRPLASDDAMRTIALVWRRGSPRAKDFALLAEVFAHAR